jgi:two-component sensor histidine kinase
MTFLWLERGGPQVAMPTKKGFGTRLIECSMAQVSGSRVKVDYEPSGLRCAIELSLSTDAEIPCLDIAQAAGRNHD